MESIASGGRSGKRRSNSRCSRSAERCNTEARSRSSVFFDSRATSPTPIRMEARDRAASAAREAARRLLPRGPAISRRRTRNRACALRSSANRASSSSGGCGPPAPFSFNRSALRLAPTELRSEDKVPGMLPGDGDSFLHRRSPLLRDRGTGTRPGSFPFFWPSKVAMLRERHRSRAGIRRHRYQLRSPRASALRTFHASPRAKARPVFSVRSSETTLRWKTNRSTRRRAAAPTPERNLSDQIFRAKETGGIEE